MYKSLLLTFIYIFVLGIKTNYAQEVSPSISALENPTSSPTSSPMPAEPQRPYDAPLLRLSELLGSLHYLRPLCKTDEGNVWREFMRKIIISEQPTPQRKARFIARFNRGYNSFSANYRTCTPSAITAANQYQTEAISIIDKVNRRYGR